MTATIEFVVPGEATPFARAGASGKRRFTPKKQRAAMIVVQMFARRQMAGRPPLEGPLHLSLECDFLVPASWSVKKKAAANYKSSKPDLDNLAKIAKDSMNGIVWIDDAQVASIYAIKRYRPVAQTRIVVTQLEALG